MQYRQIVSSALLYGSVFCGLTYGALNQPLVSLRQSLSTTPTQDIIKAIQAGDAEQMKALWVRYHGKYIDKAAIFKSACKSACKHKRYALIAWLLKTTSLAAQYYHEYGMTVLMESVSYNDVTLLTILMTSPQVDLNAQTNPGGWTALMMAAEQSSPAIVEFLLKAGADCTIKDFEGRDALWWAQSVDRQDIIPLLHEYTKKKA